MGRKKRLKHRWVEWSDRARMHLSRPDALVLLAVLGLLTGLAAGAVIIAFRLLVEGSQDALLPGRGAEAYEALPLWARLGLPLLGAVLLAAMFRWGAGGLHMLGVARVMERMAYHQGYLTVRGFVLQFVGAGLAIVSGHSVGREGPHVYLGAAAGSLLGQRLALPNNVIRTLVGCGTAAGIAASFNTPLAGVVFALEVVMLEYSVASFIPVILAAVSATTLSNAVFGTAPAFSVPPLQLGSLDELALVVLLGIAAGTASAGFIQLVQSTASRLRPVAIWWRMLLAGVFMGLCGAALPQLMGIGYDTVDLALHGGIAVGLLALLVLGKLLSTAVVIGLGVPGGMIGPALFIGAMLGALLAELVNLAGLAEPLDVGFYALLGMGAMMAGSLQAPLAALTAMLELTDNPDVILPGMLAVVVAGLTASELFRKESLFVTMLKSTGRDYDASPVLQALRRVGVASVMDRQFQRSAQQLTPEQARQLLADKPAWILVDVDGSPRALLPALDLVKYLEATPAPEQGERIDLLEIPAQRQQVAPVHLQETLQQALERLEQTGAEALYVQRMTAPGITRIYGVLTRAMLESKYRY
jgi:H+/Cl- antiporter ClcA